MPGALDRHGQGTLLASVAVGLAPVRDLAALVQAPAQSLDVLVIDDFAGAEDGLLAATSTATKPTAPAATTVATLRSVATWAISTVSARAATGTISAPVSTAIAAWAATGTIATAGAITTTIATAITAGGTLGTGAEPGAGTLLAGWAGLLACLR